MQSLIVSHADPADPDSQSVWDSLLTGIQTAIKYYNSNRDYENYDEKQNQYSLRCGSEVRRLVF